MYCTGTYDSFLHKKQGAVCPLAKNAAQASLRC